VLSPLARRVILVTVAGVAVFAGFSIYADLGELGDRLGGFWWPAFGAALALALANYAIRFVRWELYLRNRDLAVPRRSSALVFVSGFALSVTPGKVGELIKCYLLRSEHGIPIARTAPIVVAERVSDLLALIVLGIAGVAIYGVATTMVIIGGACVAVGLIVLASPRLSHGLIALVCKPKRLRRLEPRLLTFYDGLAALVHPLTLTWSTALGVAAWFCECLGFALIIAAFPGTDVPIGLASLIYATTTIAGALSFLPGGLLVTEATMTLFLVQSSGGVDHPTAVAATILTRLATLWFAVVIGLIAMAVFRRSARSGATAQVLAAQATLTSETPTSTTPPRADSEQ
jgi:uncharacterized protein (TIRG00374 family)